MYFLMLTSIFTLVAIAAYTINLILEEFWHQYEIDNKLTKFFNRLY